MAKNYGPLATARMSAQMTQADMAETLNVTLPTLVRMEKHPEEQSLKRLTAYYHAVPPEGKALIEKFINEQLVA